MPAVVLKKINMCTKAVYTGQLFYIHITGKGRQMETATKKPELLAPAGDYSCFQAALKAGADAVYIGGQRFGARAFAGNFSDEEVVEALREAHFYGRKIYLTVNTLLKQEEIKQLPEFISPFYEAGLDGVIVQDMGALSLLVSCFPGLALHASTQMTITDVRGAVFLKKLGVSRVVPARELTLPEVEALCRESGMEVEAFIHGAMCYCYSGQCLFSSLLGGRSGNRGRCAQPCRQPYRIRTDITGAECYPLSLKDMCTIQFLPDLIKAGIDSFKIEGRMKKPEYVAGVTSVYRRRIDSYLQEPEKDKGVSDKDMHILSSLYIRSEISGGYYHRHNGKEMVTLKQPGYAGCDEEVLQTVRTEILEKELSVPVVLKAYLYPGSPLRLEAWEGTSPEQAATVFAEGQLVQTASNRPLVAADVKKQLGKTGGSGFRAESILVDMADNAFLPIKALNEARRQVLELLKEERTAKQKRKESLPSCPSFDGKENGNVKELQAVPGKTRFHASVRTHEQLRACLQEGVERIYLSHSLLYSIDEAQLWDRKRKWSNTEWFLSLPAVVRRGDERRLESLAEILKTGIFEGVQIAGPGEKQWLEEIDWQGKTALDHRVYIWNRETYDFWADRMDTYCAPLELNRRALFELPGEKQELLVYGKIPMMVTANCIRKTSGRCPKEKGSTGAGAQNRVCLLDRYRTEFPVETDCAYCYNIIYNSVPLSLHAYMEEIGKHKVGAVRLDFLDEEEEQTRQRIALFRGLSGEDAESGLLSGIDWKFTTGHYKKGAE